ncbi:hypothetical protein EZE20_23775 [Arundinibacter roseus]|uniref:Uncharacterized protein n=1 Tax=Arundinibacter roseus TaxID=2070510 RepID=A0A4R4JT87_9BACT|nr:hypothetical protein EZE20_23775 [Arundinibacter roseus]
MGIVYFFVSSVKLILDLPVDGGLGVFSEKFHEITALPGKKQPFFGWTFGKTTKNLIPISVIKMLRFLFQVRYKNQAYQNNTTNIFSSNFLV